MSAFEQSECLLLRRVAKAYKAEARELAKDPTTWEKNYHKHTRLLRDSHLLTLLDRKVSAAIVRQSANETR